MTRTIRILRTLFAAIAVLAVVWPIPVHGQQGAAFSGTTLGNPDAVMAHFASLMQAGKPVAPNPFQPSWSNSRKALSDSASSDTLGLQFDRSWTTALAQYSFTAPPSFYSFAPGGAGTSDWDSVLGGAFTTYVSRSYTSYFRVSTEFETQGQRRDVGGIGEPGAQSFTTELEFAHLLPSPLGPMEIATGTYQQRQVSDAAFANSPLSTPFLGYSGSAAGLETSVTLPDKNISFTFRQGTERANGVSGRFHATQFGFSWTW